MWPFKQKTTVIGLPPLPGMAKDTEITLLSEDGSIPEDIPQLESKPNAPEHMEGNPAIGEVSVRVQKPTLRIAEKFVKTDNYRSILSEISSINSDLDNIDFEIERVVELKEKRHDGIESLQGGLDDVSKKLMFIENMLFGG